MLHGLRPRGPRRRLPAHHALIHLKVSPLRAALTQIAGLVLGHLGRDRAFSVACRWPDLLVGSIAEPVLQVQRLLGDVIVLLRAVGLVNTLLRFFRLTRDFELAFLSTIE